ncbi:MAG TPA: type II secretion system F family protein [Capsulimonadaceae bacterium]|nr:type II secretion system F family protein [Capsulimonadaceae bacterium]
MLYSYEAKDEAGRTITGQLEAESERLVAGRLRDMGYFPMRVAVQRGGGAAVSLRDVGVIARQSVIPGQLSIWNQPQESWFKRNVLFPLWTGVSLPDLAFFYRQLAAMLNAGVPLYRTLTTIQEQLRPGLLRKAVYQISDHVQAGGTLTDALGQFPYIFSDLQRSMIGVAEQTGGLDIMLGRVSDYIEREYALRQMIKRETFYPKTVFVLAFLLPPLYLLVLHQGATYFQTAIEPILWFLTGMATVYVTGRYALRSETMRLVYDTCKSHLPYFGNTVRMLAMAKFARAFAALYSAGVSVPESLTTAARVAGNAYLAQGIRRTAEALIGGATITEAFNAARVFPPMVTSMVSTGETTGSLDTMLEKAADYYEGEAAVRLHKSAQMLGVLFLLAAGVYVGFKVVQFYSGYFNGLLNAGDGGGGDGP